MKAELVLIRAQKALHILKKQGMNALIAKIRSKTSTQASSSAGQRDTRSTQPITDAKPIFVGRILGKEKLQVGITSHLKGSDIRVAFSHDNYLESVGGLQLKIADEQLKVNGAGKDFLQVFVFGATMTLSEFDEDSLIGVNLNGKWVGYTRPQFLVDCLAESSSELTVEGLSIHHLMGFDLRFIEKIIEVSQPPKLTFWLHDFFSLCPGYLLLRNDLEFCGAPDVKSNACNLCIYGERRAKHLKEVERFFLSNTVEVISPSEFALELWQKAFPVKGVLATVCPHASLEYQDTIPNPPINTAIKIAFVGFPVYHKGWETWLRLTEKFRLDPRYEFILFSETRRPSRYFKNVSVSVTKDNRNQMAETLRNHNIDVAFLWSICPETFSFTLYESLSAGCMILTNRNSGNIQAYVREHPDTGMVLDNENALLELFESGTLVEYLAEGQKEGRKSAKLVINDGC